MQKTAKNCKKSYVSDKENRANHSITVENARQINLFLQNKPNSPNVQLSLTYLSTMNYVISTSLTKVKNKANSNPIQSQFKANSNPIKAKTNPIKANFTRETGGER